MVYNLNATEIRNLDLGKIFHDFPMLAKQAALKKFGYINIRFGGFTSLEILCSNRIN